jgi:hypothetical protein
MIQLPRTINLSSEEDVSLLRTTTSAVQGTSDLVREHLSDYLQLFPEDHWRKVYPDGLMVVKGRNGPHIGLSLEAMLRITRSLKKLSGYKGIEKLVGGFRNPTQVLATCFEVDVAEWCAGRALTSFLEFAPEIVVRGKKKYPEFLWGTMLGNLYVECKRAQEFENDFTRRLGRFRTIAEEEHRRQGTWSESLRLDIVIDGPARKGTEHRLRNVIAQAFVARQSASSGQFSIEDHEIRAWLRSRQEQPPTISGTAKSGCIVVGTQPTKVEAQNSILTITISVEAHRARAAGNLL